MCGITGIWHTDGRSVDPNTLQQMTDALRHRGPDDEGYLLVNTVLRKSHPAGGSDTHPALELDTLHSHHGTHDLAFGHRRLAILDLSENGHGPLSYAEGDLWITYNGEVYNYLELRAELGACGYRFRSGTDTEVVLAAYQEWGVHALDRFNGMFAFALWDARRRRLFCARDRLGVKPFYYRWDGVNFVFASEPKALTRFAQVFPDEGVIYDYLAWAELDHSAGTFFAEIHKLLPGHYMIVEPEHISVRQWWTPGFQIEHDAAANAAASTLKELLAESVRLRLRSDVPIGSCLSGGLDSSSVVALVNQHLREGIIGSAQIGEQQRTFTAYYSGVFDERSYAESVRQATGAAAFQVSPSSAEFWTDLEAVLRFQDEPVAGATVFSQWAVMRLAKQNGVTVLLDGQAADELFAGYPNYAPLYQGELLRTGRGLRALTSARASSRMSDSPLGKDLARVMYYAFAPASLQTNMRRRRDKVAFDALVPDFATRNDWREWPAQTGLRSRKLNARLRADTLSHSLPKLLRYEDRNSMAHSIEARVPFTDHRLVEFALQLPASLKIHQGWSKWILREAMAELVPDKIRWRRDKVGFPAPEGDWLRAGRAKIFELLLAPDARAKPYLRREGLRERIESELNSQNLNHSHLWRWLNLELWLQTQWG